MIRHLVEENAQSSSFLTEEWIAAIRTRAH